MTEYAQIKFTADVGILATGEFKNTLTEYCFRRGYDLSIKSGFGIFEKPMFVKIICPKSEHKKALEEIKKLF